MTMILEVANVKLLAIAISLEGGKAMTSLATNIPLTVSTDGTAGLYLIVTAEQHPTVAEALQVDGVTFHAEEDIVRLNGAPALVVIELGPGADVDRVQKSLGPRFRKPAGQWKAKGPVGDPGRTSNPG